MATRALVVGGTAGIGHAIALHVASDAQASVIISGRNQPKDLDRPNIEFRSLDASSMRAIKQYTDQLKAAPAEKLDLLVMTQGIGTTAGRNETPEGIDLKMALHYYGKQLLIRELAPILKDDAKVLIVLDGARGSPKKLIWDDLDLKTNFSLMNAANHCLSMTDAMVQHYAAEQKNKGDDGGHRQFVHAYPGAVKTNIFAGLPWYARGPAKVLSHVIAVSPETCAARMVSGTYETAEAGRKAGTFWSNIDDKGKSIATKAIWTDEERNKVAEHTWKVIDGALATEA